ncbi:MAG TPA: hypothetical protein VJ836_03025 [Candidatus Saccharimonadales bacterium]|nr:hypothetical protein [Candidatus Saccharimonadales bacterium]
MTDQKFSDFTLEFFFLNRLSVNLVPLNEELGREVPGMETPPLIHRYIKKSAEGTPTLYSGASKVGRIDGTSAEKTTRHNDA